MSAECFGFEADFTADLRCIPMAVRRKLDLAGVKLKLVHWNGLSAAERLELLAWGDDPEAVAALGHWLLERSASLPDGPAKPLPPAHGEAWQQPWSSLAAVPEKLRSSIQQLNLAVGGQGWQGLSELQRFALMKLSHPGHEHRNLPRALAEFGLLADATSAERTSANPTTPDSPAIS